MINFEGKTPIERYAIALRLIREGKGEQLDGTGRCRDCAHYVGEHHGFTGDVEMGRCGNCATCRGNLYDHTLVEFGRAQLATKRTRRTCKEVK